MSFYGRWEPYVPVARRRANAASEAKKLVKKGRSLRPIQVTSRTIANSFWGLAWCNNLNKYADWANRMPRGRTYVRNGSIVDLQIGPGTIEALVCGSSLYRIQITIAALQKTKWLEIRKDCSRQVGSLLDLMRGKLPDSVLKRLTDAKGGMFPSPGELNLYCSCPDYATMCKHIAATMYGVGHLLDTEPELFFKMRGVDQSELVSHAMSSQSSGDTLGLDRHSDLADEDLGALFGIDLVTNAAATTRKSKSKSKVNQQTNSLHKVSIPTIIKKKRVKKVKPTASSKLVLVKSSRKKTTAAQATKTKTKSFKQESQDTKTYKQAKASNKQKTKVAKRSKK